jgi:hypothetical protein
VSPSPRFAASTVALEERSFLRPIAAFRGIERERGVRAARGRLNGAEDPNSFSAFRLIRRRVRGAARLYAYSALVAKNRKRRSCEKPKMEPLGL